MEPTYRYQTKQPVAFHSIFMTVTKVHKKKECTGIEQRLYSVVEYSLFY